MLQWQRDNFTRIYSLKKNIVQIAWPSAKRYINHLKRNTCTDLGAKTQREYEHSRNRMKMRFDACLFEYLVIWDLHTHALCLWSPCYEKFNENLSLLQTQSEYEYKPYTVSNGRKKDTEKVDWGGREKVEDEQWGRRQRKWLTNTA